jgi:hypothetical protein
MMASRLATTVTAWCDFENHCDINRAIVREKEIKRWRRARKIALIECLNPIWADLSRDWYECEPDYKRALDRIENIKATADPSLSSG